MQISLHECVETFKPWRQWQPKPRHAYCIANLEKQYADLELTTSWDKATEEAPYVSFIPGDIDL